MSFPLKIGVHHLPHGVGLALPTYQSAHSAGLDLLAAVAEDAPLTLAPGQYALVPTGLTMALPAGFEAQVRPRSGLAAKHGVTVLNAPGTIDADYRGESRTARRAHRADGDRTYSARRTRAGGLARHDRTRHRWIRLDRPLRFARNYGLSFRQIANVKT